jgi:hypothetical protein
MRPCLRSLCFFLGLAGAAHAQPSGEPVPQADVVSLQFRVMAWGGDVPALAYGRRQKIEATEVNLRSANHSYSGPATLTFTRYTDKADDPKAAPVVASVKLPADAKKVTLLTMPTGKGRYAMYAVSEDTMPPRHSRVHNLSSEPLVVGYNANERVELAPGGSVLVTAPGRAVVIRVARQVNGRWRELFNNIVELSETGSTNVLLSPGPQGGGLGMFALAEWPAEPVPEPAPAAGSPP